MVLPCLPYFFAVFFYWVSENPDTPDIYIGKKPAKI
jgi:hypothetical protein